MSGRTNPTDMIPTTVKDMILDNVLPRYPDSKLAAEITDAEIAEALSTFEDETVLYNMTVSDEWLMFYCWLCTPSIHEDLMVRFIREITGEKEPVVEEPDNENQELIDELRGLI